MQKPKCSAIVLVSFIIPDLMTVGLKDLSCLGVRSRWGHVRFNQHVRECFAQSVAHAATRRTNCVLNNITTLKGSLLMMGLSFWHKGEERPPTLRPLTSKP